MRLLNNIIATNVKRERILQGYTQKKLAQKCNHSKSTISKIETGRLPSVNTLCDLANCLNCSLDDICEWDKNKSI